MYIKIIYYTCFVCVALFTKLGCEQRNAPVQRDAPTDRSVDIEPDRALSRDMERDQSLSRDMNPDATLDAEPDVGVDADVDAGDETERAEACDAWALRNRELVERLTAATVTDCQVGSYGRCDTGQLLTINCGDALHTWCRSSNVNDLGRDFAEGFTQLVTERCEEAPAGCSRETERACEALMPFCMPTGECVLLEDREEDDCEDIRAEVFSAPSRPLDALCDHPSRVCQFSSYASCYSEECHNQCSIYNRFTCIDGVPVAEGAERLVCEGYDPHICEGYTFGRNTCTVEGDICIETRECDADICGDECRATLCLNGSWTEVLRRDHVEECQ